MLPLKIAILWHQHQPYYKQDGEFILPWVRMHGVKDYYDLPEILHEFPNIKVTFNLVPSLMLQIEEYASGNTCDTVQRLTAIPAAGLTAKDKNEILRLFFLCNADHMIFPYERYKELYDRAKSGENVLVTFTELDWLDLQVWYNLTWIGRYSRSKPIIARLFNQGRNFTEDEKQIVLKYHLEILSKITEQMVTLKNFGQIEISVSPMYHPILPLLCNSKSAMEAMPQVTLPDPVFEYPQDALAQVEYAIDYYNKKFGWMPTGMWPSEGSISDEALDIIVQSGIKWVASDEMVLSATLKDKYKPIEKFFPRKFKSGGGEIAVLFRDHFLSDNIGFVYSQWDPNAAARDFCQHLRNIRQEIISKMGENALEHAVVPVILDGENCWEYYPGNGVPFLRALYTEMTRGNEFQTVTFSQAIGNDHSNFLPAIDHVCAGSWINANFSIWIGHKDHVAAWEMLGKARQAVNLAKPSLSVEDYRKAMTEISIAEGSDWFWWYGDEHIAENKDKFDVLFRWHIEQVYKIIGEEAPANVGIPISEYEYVPLLMQQHGEVKPEIDGKIRDEEKWENAGFYDAKKSMSTMHQVGELIKRLWFAADKDKVCFRCDTIRKMKADDKIEIKFKSPVSFTIELLFNGLNIIFEDNSQMKNFIYATDEIIEFAISRDTFFKDYKSTDGSYKIDLAIVTKTNDGELIYPRQGSLEIVF